METRTTIKSLRLTPRKVRAVADLLKGKDAVAAIGQLEFLIKRPSSHMIKLLNSALSNAENNFQLVKENLYIKSLFVNEGVKLRRFKPKGFGRTSPIQKKTSHITLVLDERVPGLKAKDRPKPTHEHKQDHEHEEVKTKTSDDKKPEIKTEIGQKKKGFVKKLFQRKAV